jgi:hypothetical protein
MRNCAVSFGAALTMADWYISSASLRAEGPRSLRTSVGLPAMSAYYSIRANAARIGSIVDASQEKFDAM